jgi:signal transduction histidine kinase
MVLAVLPGAIALLSEPPTALAAVLLAVLLPAVIALDANRPARLDRALLTSVAVAALVLIGGVLRGLHPVAASAVLACFCIELTLLGSTRLRRQFANWLLPVLAASFASFWIAHANTEPFANAAPVLSAALLTLAFGQLALLAVCLRMQDRRQPSQNATLAAATDEPDIIVDTHGQVQSWSVGAGRVLGFPASGLKDRGLMDLVLVADRPLFMMEVREALARETSRRIRLRLRVAPDTVEQGYHWMGLTLDRKGQASGQLKVTFWPVETDVAREKHLADTPIDDTAATALRASFISRMNHELRTPLNAVIGFSDIMMRGGFEGEQMRDFAREINEAGQDLLRTASLMIDITRMEKGVFQLDESEQDLTALVESVLRSESDAESYDFIAPDADAWAHLDGRILRTALQQILALTRFDASQTRKRRLSLRVSGDSVDVALGRVGDPDAANLSAVDARTMLTEAPSACRLGLAMAQGVAALHQSSLILSTSQAGNLQMRWRFKRIAMRSDEIDQLKAA